MWKKVIETGEILAYEKALDDLNIRIEARMKSEHENGPWELYVKYFTNSKLQKVNFTETFSCKDTDEAKEMISCLKKSQLKTLKEVIQLKLNQQKEVKLNIKRTFRDYNNEGWVFKVNKDDQNNRVFIKEADSLDVDIILYEKYKVNEEKIIEKLVEMLGLSNNDIKTKITVYYCKTKVKYFLEEGYLENMQKC